MLLSQKLAHLEFCLTIEDGGDHDGLVDWEQEPGGVADQEGGHGAQQDGRARHVGLLSVALGLLGLAAVAALKSVGDCLVLLELPVDDDVEGQEGQEGQEWGGCDPGPGGVPQDVILKWHIECQ